MGQFGWRGHCLVLVGLAVLGSWALLPGLDHSRFSSGDEAAHMAAARGVFESGLPRIRPNPLEPVAPGDWQHSEVFLHKPSLPFFLGGWLMHLLGPTPLALRLVSFGSALLTAFAIYGFGAGLVGGPLAAAAAASFLLLPFGFRLVQGISFGDVTDCTLVAAVSVTVWATSSAVERGSKTRAAFAGALCGIGYLCKGPLALGPVAVLLLMAWLGARGWSTPVRRGVLVRYGLAFAAVALPWNLYSAWRWPSVFAWEARHTLGFLIPAAPGDFLYTGPRFYPLPFDALFGYITADELAPWPAALAVISALWVAKEALRKRDPRFWALCLWIWCEWVPLAIAAIKVPAHAWGAAPAVLLGIAVFGRDAARRPALALAAVGAFCAAPAMAVTDKLAGVPLSPRIDLFWIQSEIARWELFEGLALAALGIALGGWISRRVKGGGWELPWQVVPTLAGAGCLAVALLWAEPRLFLQRRNSALAYVSGSFTETLGRSLAALLPPKSDLFLDTTGGNQYRILTNELRFYSGVPTYDFSADLVDRAKERGDHPYLVSSLAQPYRRVAGVPASAWLQAFDLDAPLPSPEPPPSGMTPLDTQLGELTLLGLAKEPGDGHHDRYVFYCRTPFPAVPPFTVRFNGPDIAPARGPGTAPRKGKTANLMMNRGQLLAPESRLPSARWFTMTVLAPRGATFEKAQLSSERRSRG